MTIVRSIANSQIISTLSNHSNKLVLNTFLPLCYGYKKNYYYQNAKKYYSTTNTNTQFVNEEFNKARKMIAKDLHKKTLASMEKAYGIMTEYDRTTYNKSPLASSLGSFKDSIDQLKDNSFLLVVVGEFNSGKSSFLNALLGDRYLKEGITPTTHRINRIEFGETISQHTIPSRLSNTEHEIIQLPVEWLKEFSLVDTPGTNAVIEGHQEITEHFIPKSDLVLFVTSIDRAFSESEKIFLEKVKKWGKKIVVIISKTDLIENNPLSSNAQSELNEVINFVKDNFKSQLNVEPMIFPLSSKLALKAKLELSSSINNLNNNLNNNNNSSNINYNNLLSSTSVEPNNINNNNKYTQKFYQELENNINWKKSKFLDLEKYILQSLDSNERVKLKLLNPLGVADKLYSEFDEEYRSQQSVLDFDFENINLAVAQINEHQIDLNKDLRHQLERIDTILLRMENRANTFLDNEIQFSNLLKLLRGEEIRNQFEKHVIDGTNQEIEQLVRNLVDNIVDKNTKRWKSIIDLINQKSSNKSQKVVGFIRDTHDSSDFSSNRQQTINDMGERTTKTLSSYDRDNESLLVSRDIKNAIYQAILFEAGTVGVATILSTAFFDLTGVLGIGALAITGLAWVPFKKAQLKRSISSKITNLRLQLHDTIQDHIGEEIRISSNKIQLGIQPYIDFTNNESKKINDLSIKLGECKDERQTLIYDIEKYFK
ncbi:hypothetical protein DDB_G0287331 [Dictyostelium discoideum AX4]|uniref:Dynamin N-terminal domain-containing protein n=1 Tax=Dictyostelium discoideum TaxID=44689 RepID=Q54KI1_DICDI|nr:hypothetical protein DDB_G0287331 [Dictyostelium discoideum AX4]EAL63733.1 hypothetical protein DDB_G0287331 [Dictyostelium discoideum AX4]|eukprot:XP_637242.1 hypothetical protein DDB_G0287331 [Dictyostelium discoideum AX4]